MRIIRLLIRVYRQLPCRGGLWLLRRGLWKARRMRVRRTMASFFLALKHTHAEANKDRQKHDTLARRALSDSRVAATAAVSSQQQQHTACCKAYVKPQQGGFSGCNEETAAASKTQLLLCMGRRKRRSMHCCPTFFSDLLLRCFP